jgi:hypothetical protein
MSSSSTSPWLAGKDGSAADDIAERNGKVRGKVRAAADAADLDKEK